MTKKSRPKKGLTTGAGTVLPIVEVRVAPARDVDVNLPPPVPVTSTWTRTDLLGAWKVRWGIGRMRYFIAPGLYALNNPDSGSPVLVSANYKLSFDILRRSMTGRKAWILVLDTAGINVWCAAGKGTFGTDEMIRRVRSSGLEEIVDHRRLIVPQLGGPGVAGHVVREETGFRVVFGPVRADDLPAFFDARRKATPAMRKITFTVAERMALVPMELVPALKWSLPILALLGLAGGFGGWGYSWTALRHNGTGLLLAYGGGLAAGAVITPALLPWLPGRSFSAKGLMPGLLWAAFLVFAGNTLAPGLSFSSWDKAAWLLGLPALSAFLAMNFTGSAVSTSLSGVKKEMRFAFPLQVAGAVGAVVLWMAGHFLKGIPA